MEREPVFIIVSDTVEEPDSPKIFRAVEAIHGTFESGMKEMERLREEYEGADEHMEVTIHTSNSEWAAFRCWDGSYFEMSKMDVQS